DDDRLFFRSAEETTANLSRGGAFVRSWEPLAAGRRVVVTIDLSRDEELQLVGRVVWTRRRLGPGQDEAPGYGVEFLQPTAAERSALDALLSRAGATPSAGPIASSVTALVEAATAHPSSAPSEDPGSPEGANGPRTSSPDPLRSAGPAPGV
ncbi:MAG TPA: PilZ domain-containing protein, partial [Myxococcota bacterium]|nr:PilZ domain-containing protein [Myxococcota bacterium]